MIKILAFLNIFLSAIFLFYLSYKSYKNYEMESFYLLLFSALINLFLGVLIWV